MNVQMKNDARSTLNALAPRARGYTKLIEIALTFGLIGLIWAGEVALITYLQAIRCPQSTFLSGSPRIASIFVMVAPFFAAIGPGLLVSNMLTGVAPATRRFFDGNAKLRRSPDFQRDQARLVKFAVALAVVGLTVSVVASLSQFCLTHDAILNRAAPWNSMRSYSWSAVKTVRTSCVRGSKGSWVAGYALGLPGDQTLDIMGGTAPAWKFEPQIFAALHPVPFEFDASKVSPDCAVTNVDMLSRRP